MMLQFFMLACALYALFSEMSAPSHELQEPRLKRHELGTLG